MLTEKEFFVISGAIKQISKVFSWNNIFNYFEKNKSSVHVKGAYFEYLCKHLLIYLGDDVCLHNEIDKFTDVRKKKNIPEKDQGIDLLIKKTKTKIYGGQCKYKNNQGAAVPLSLIERCVTISRKYDLEGIIIFSNQLTNKKVRDHPEVTVYDRLFLESNITDTFFADMHKNFNGFISNNISSSLTPKIVNKKNKVKENKFNLSETGISLTKEGNDILKLMNSMPLASMSVVTQNFSIFILIKFILDNKLNDKKILFVTKNNEYTSTIKSFFTEKNISCGKKIPNQEYNYFFIINLSSMETRQKNSIIEKLYLQKNISTKIIAFDTKNLFHNSFNTNDLFGKLIYPPTKKEIRNSYIIKKDTFLKTYFDTKMSGEQSQGHIKTVVAVSNMIYYSKIKQLSTVYVLHSSEESMEIFLSVAPRFLDAGGLKYKIVKDIAKVKLDNKIIIRNFLSDECEKKILEEPSLIFYFCGKNSQTIKIIKNTYFIDCPIIIPTIMKMKFPADIPHTLSEVK